MHVMVGMDGHQALNRHNGRDTTPPPHANSIECLGELGPVHVDHGWFRLRDQMVQHLAEVAPGQRNVPSRCAIYRALCSGCRVRDQRTYPEGGQALGGRLDPSSEGL